MTKRRAIKTVSSIILFVILSGLGLGFNQHGRVSLPERPSAPPGYVPVTHVTDGDTFDVRIAGQTEIVRVIGIDTPETHDPRKPVQCFGQAAATQAHKLLDGKSVRLEADPTNTNRDKYHRLLRYVYLEDGTLYNKRMIEDGYAFAYVLFPFQKMDEFRQAERDARDHNRGLWAGCQIHNEGQKEQTNNQ